MVQAARMHGGSMFKVIKHIALRTVQAVGILLTVATLGFLVMFMYFDQAETNKVMAEIQASR
jgi:ABC-type polysaccharide transport system permease subunit